MFLFKNLVAAAVAAVVLAAIGVTAVVAALNPSAGEVAANTPEINPAVPPGFYGSR
ncbi:hypothetical protein [Actinoplanes sp. DH11]|uniref:hypothetical protein n=1 Tax=Actinoplanes sp. DH11 TaxID=2857011 RepID=UPI001E623D8A|nr:hypothetical protein [Actinoplanes sp. DH11]